MSSLVNPTYAMNDGKEVTNPWMNTKLSAEERTELLLDEMTIEQKIQQIAISRFNENDTGETVVINKGGTSKYQNGEFAPEGTLPGCEWQASTARYSAAVPHAQQSRGGQHHCWQPARCN